MPTLLKVRGRAAHPPGPTFLAYTPDGRKLVTAGSNNVIRVYETGSDGEPINIDDCQENNLAVAATVCDRTIFSFRWATLHVCAPADVRARTIVS